MARTNQFTFVGLANRQFLGGGTFVEDVKFDDNVPIRVFCEVSGQAFTVRIVEMFGEPLTQVLALSNVEISGLIAKNVDSRPGR